MVKTDSAQPGVAYASRNRAALLLRWCRHVLLRGAQLKLYGDFDRWPRPQALHVRPRIRSAEELDDLMARLEWYVGGLPQPVHVWTEPGLRLDAERPREDNIVLQDRPAPVGSRDWLLFHRLRGGDYLRYLQHLGRSVIVDPFYYSVSESCYWSMMFQCLVGEDASRRVAEVSRNNWRRLAAQCGDVKQAFCIATGPSCETATQFAFPENSLRIVCNSIVKNEALLQHLRPQVLAFADPVFHFGPSPYAQRFREDALSAVRRHGMFVLAPYPQASLLLERYPVLADRLIQLTVTPGAVDVVSREPDFRAAGTGNILTMFMVPVARSFTGNVVLLGVDGRDRRERYFWTHSPKSQYGDLMQTAFQMHPSFFRDRDYGAYYKDHCKSLAQQVASIERDGGTVTTWTPSKVPCLVDRLRPPV